MQIKLLSNKEDLEGLKGRGFNRFIEVYEKIYEKIDEIIKKVNKLDALHSKGVKK